MFSKSKYTQWYLDIIAAAQRRVSSGYTESHHIIPKCMGGNNRASNLVSLTAREHFICHWLLTKMVTDASIKYKLWNAFSCMLYRENEHQDRYKITSRKFDNIKVQGAKIRSLAWSGSNNPMFNKKHSDEARGKMSLANTGRIFSEESKRKISQRLSNKPKSEQHKNSLKMGSAKRWTDDARKQWGIKMRERKANKENALCRA